MNWFVLALSVLALAVLCVGGALVALFYADGQRWRLMEVARVEIETRRAERLLHDMASDSFQTMLNEARTLGAR